jgi:hypothetical protein
MGIPTRVGVGALGPASPDLPAGMTTAAEASGHRSSCCSGFNCLDAVLPRQDPRELGWRHIETRSDGGANDSVWA